MTIINPINVNTQGIGAAGYGAAGAKAEAEPKKDGAQVGAEAKQAVSPDKVLDYLAASSASVVPKKAINPAKYVDAASAERIAGFMAGFEDKVTEGLKAFDAEFGAAKVSEGAKMAVVLKNIEQEM